MNQLPLALPSTSSLFAMDERYRAIVATGIDWRLSDGGLSIDLGTGGKLRLSDAKLPPKARIAIMDFAGHAAEDIYDLLLSRHQALVALETALEGEGNARELVERAVRLLLEGAR